MRRALLLAYHFPPIGGAGVQRSVKFARYLPEQGYEPVIVTGPAHETGDHWTPADDSLAADLSENLEVLRVEEPEPPAAGSWRRRAHRWVGLSDPFAAWWTRGAIATGGRAGAVDLVCASMSPFESGAAAARLARELRVPWIADLRDPWALDEMLVYPSSLHRRLEQRKMARVLRSADAIVWNTEEAEASARSAFPELRDKPMAVITNGYDPADFDVPAEQRNDEVFRIVHTGFLHTELGRSQRQKERLRSILGGTVGGVDFLTRSHVFLLDAVERLVRRGHRIEVHLAGNLSGDDQAAISTDVVRSRGYLSHAESIALMRSADLLFLPMHDLPVGRRARIVPGKTYEYLGAGRPILAAVPDGDARDLLERTVSQISAAPPTSVPWRRRSSGGSCCGRGRRPKPRPRRTCCGGWTGGSSRSSSRGSSTGRWGSATRLQTPPRAPRPSGSSMRARLKDFLNEQAGTRLEQLGYSGGRVRDAKREAWWWLQARGRALSTRRRLRAGTAVVWTDAGRAELVRTEVALAGPGEITVSVHASAVSPGTERAQYLHLPNAEIDYPHTPGYSAAGVVVEVGEGVTGLELGDRVAVRGLSHASVGTVQASQAFRVPAAVELRDAALVELGVIGGQGVRHARLERGASVCVLGAGLVGALAQRLAAACGAGDVTVVARTRRREQTARAGGAAAFVLADDADALEAIAAPVVIEATGDPEAIETAVAAAAPDGRIVLLGSPRGTTRELPLARIRDKRLTLVGAHVNTLSALGRLSGRDEFRVEAESFLSALAEGRLEVSDLVSEALDPRESDAFYRRLGSAGDVVGAVFDWTRLPLQLRDGEARLTRLPDLSGAGLDAEQRPLPSRTPLRKSGDPLAAPKGLLRIGLLGCGDIAVQNAAAVVAAPNADLIAAFDPVNSLAEDLTRRYGGSALESVEAVLDRADVDAVFLSVPHHLHAPLCLQAVEAGKHVIVEKPLANNLVAAREMADAAARAGVVLSVCFPHRYEPNAVAAKRLIEAGALGDFGGSIASIFADKPASYWLGGFTGRSMSDWRASRERAGGGVLIMNLSHYVDLLRHLSGVEAELISASTHTATGEDVEDTVSLTVRYANGALGTIFGSAALRGDWTGRNELRLWGTEGHIALEPDARVYTTRAVDGLRTCRWHALEAPAADMRQTYVSRLATAIAEGCEPEVTADDGLAVQAFVEAAYRSQEERTSIRPADLLNEAAE